MIEWSQEFGAAVTVCDTQGVVLYMNDRADKTFERDGGASLVGKSLLDCHPEPARSKLVALLKEQRRNAYTIEKNGIKKLIYQAPWYKDGQFAGLVELSLEVPFEMPHFIR
jgi:transcriptional regulator with PAS, ATPase and Fis domain